MHSHFFQRYYSKENVDTNIMLLLSRLYQYSSIKFFAFLGKIMPENADVELFFNFQEKNKESVSDAKISQANFKVVVETKLYGNFRLKQLMNHLTSFKNEDYKVLLTLDPHFLDTKIKDQIDKQINNYNIDNKSNVVHCHLTFEELIKNIEEIIDDRDYEMIKVLEDYKEYCYYGGLIPDDWKRMRVQLSWTTLNTNKKLNLYYDNAERGSSGHKYLGLYSKKEVRAIGKIIAIVTALPTANGLDITVEKAKITDEMKNNILEAIKDSKKYGYNLSSIRHRYFFVEKFYDTFFEKKTQYAPMGSRMFDLTEILGIEKLPDMSEIAKLLKNKTW